MARVFLDIDIGDKVQYAAEVAEWERACKFLSSSGVSYGLSGATPSDLDDAGKELLLEVYGSDPAAADGPKLAKSGCRLADVAARQVAGTCERVQQTDCPRLLALR